MPLASELSRGGADTAAPVRLVDLGEADYRLTQAAYHAVAEGMNEKSPDTVLLCRPASPYLCLGYHEVFKAVLEQGACRQRGLPVLRRRVGGGTTYLDGDQLFYQFVFHHSRLPARPAVLYGRLLAAPVTALRALGLETGLRAVNEIEVGGRRIAGVGGARIGEAAVVVGNLLLDFDYGVLPEVWRTPGSAFRELAAATLRDRLTTLRRLGCSISMTALQALLAAELPRALGRPLRPGSLAEGEARRAEALCEELGAPAFLALHARPPVEPMARLKIAADAHVVAEGARLGEALVRGAFTVRAGRIEAARLESDPPEDWGGRERALRGLLFERWKEALGAA